jgi:hypothetical protein
LLIGLWVGRSNLYVGRFALSSTIVRRKTMKLRALNLLVLLSILLGIAACGEKPVPTKTVIVTTQATPVVATVIATDHKQTAPPSDNTMTERISRLMEFYDKNGQFSGTILVAQDGNITYEGERIIVLYIEVPFSFGENAPRWDTEQAQGAQVWRSQNC